MKGYRVFVVGFDPQACLSKSFGLKIPEDGETLSESLLNMSGLPRYFVSENLDLCPGDANLENLDICLNNDRRRGFRFRDLLAKLSDDYDYVFVDTPPSRGTGTISTLAASDFAIIVTEPTEVSVDGISRTLEMCEKILQYNSKLKILGIVINRDFPSTKNSRALKVFLNRKYPGLVFNHSIRNSVVAAEAFSAGKDVITYKIESPIARDAISFATEAREKIENNNNKK